jgi:hypothetical protein
MVLILAVITYFHTTKIQVLMEEQERNPAAEGIEIPNISIPSVEEIIEKYGPPPQETSWKEFSSSQGDFTLSYPSFFQTIIQDPIIQGEAEILLSAIDTRPRGDFQVFVLRIVKIQESTLEDIISVLEIESQNNGVVFEVVERIEENEHTFSMRGQYTSPDQEEVFFSEDQIELTDEGSYVVSIFASGAILDQEREVIDMIFESLQIIR